MENPQNFECGKAANIVGKNPRIGKQSGKSLSK